ncbi:MAG: protein kinase [Planctomycetes bacterium]|nr:protein kinase [Planctomycetota bacterium]
MQLRRYKERVADGPETPDEAAAARPDPDRLLPRPMDGPFDLVREIGSGSSGTVYQAVLTRAYRDQSAGTEVAVKFLRPELLADRKAHERLFAEGELGMSIRHPNVAEIYGVETVEVLGVRTTYLLMQYVAGTTLRELLQRSGPAIEDLCRRLGADAARGLFALHRRGLVHRDVKPENLILTPASELKIVDLGLVRPFGSEAGGSPPGHSSTTSSGFGLAGSVAYSAPETLRGAPASPRSDLYALGVVLYEVTTGQHPFADATTPDEMMHAHLYRLPPLPSHLRPRVSPLLEQVLLDLLQKKPEDRPKSASDLARILEQAERSDYWRRHEERAPVLASSRRLMRMRRPAEAEFVDRRAESAQLDEAFAAAQNGRGAVLAVVAPESTGRRRLLDEAMQRWLDGPQAPRYLGGDADSGFGHGEPFASTLLDLLLRGDDRHTPNARTRAVARARDRFDLDEPDAEALVAVAFGDSTETSEVRANRLANAFLALPQKGQPLVVRVDHADELDTSGRLVLQRLAAAAPKTWLLVLLAAGPDTALVQADQRLELGGLDERSFLQFGRSLFRAPVDEQVDDYLRGAHQILSGLPGSLLEALEHLVDQGDLRGRVGDYHQLAGDAEPAPAPRHVERFRERVQSLDPAHRAVLSAAAVLGDRCSLAELSALILQPELAVLETLSLFRGRIVRAQGGELTFRHRDFRRALLRSLPAEERQRLHAAAAEVLEARGAPPLVIGMHRSQALDHEGCLEPLLQALDNRVRAGSRRTALRLAGRLAVHFRHVAETERNERLRLRFLVLSAQAQQNADQSAAATRLFREAERLARKLADLDASAAARIGLATDALYHGRMLAAITLLETVHDDLADERAHGGEADELACKAHALHGRILLYLGQAADCMKQLLLAKQRVPVEEEDLRCHLWIDLARAEALAHRYATALRTLQAIEKAHPVRHLPRARLRFHLYRGQLRALTGDPEAGQELRQAFEEANRLALPVYAARAALFRGERQFFRGRDDEALARFEEALAMARLGGDRVGEASARCQLVRYGADDADLPALIDELDLPELHASWLLAMAGSGRPVADTAARLDALLQDTDLPLSVHLRALAWLERPASARSLVRAVSERFVQRTERKRFVQQWQGSARI